MKSKMRKTLLVASALVAGAAVVGTAAYFALGAEMPLVEAADDYERTFRITSENTTIYTNTLNIVHTADDGATLEMKAEGNMAPSDGTNLATMYDGSSVTCKTFIRELRSIRLYYDGPGTITLFTSRDGTNFVEIGEVTSGVDMGGFTYAPHYFKIVASGECNLEAALVNADCGTYDPSDLGDFVGTYKGTITYTEYYVSFEPDQELADVTVEVGLDSLSFKNLVLDEETSDVVWEDIELFPVGGSAFATEMTLALDYNDPNPAETWTINKSGSRLTISYASSDGCVYIDFSGYEFVDATSIAVLADDVAVGAEGLSLSQGQDILLEADVEPWNVTEEVVWSIENTDVVGFTHTGNKTEATGEMVTLHANAGGEAIINVACGTFKTTVSVSVEALSGESINEIPAQLVGTAWSGTSPDGYYLEISFEEDAISFDADGYYFLFDSETADFIADMSSKNGNVYTLVFDKSFMDTFNGFSFSYDSSSNSLTAITGDVASGEFDMAGTVFEPMTPDLG